MNRRTMIGRAIAGVAGLLAFGKTAEAKNDLRGEVGECVGFEYLPEPSAEERYFINPMSGDLDIYDGSRMIGWNFRNQQIFIHGHVEMHDVVMDSCHVEILEKSKLEIVSYRRITNNVFNGDLRVYQPEDLGTFHRWNWWRP